MSELDNLVPELLPRLRADLEALDSEMLARFERIRRRLDVTQGSDSEGALGSLVGHRAMVERTMASFEDEVARLKRRVKLLETAQS